MTNKGNQQYFPQGIRTGIDIIEIKRLEALITKAGDRFVKHYFTDREIAYCRSKAHSAVHFAGRLAAKEAVYKALALTWNHGFSWKNIEISEAAQRSPGVVLLNTFLQYFEMDGYQGIEVSISHAGEYAVASAVIW